MSNKGIKAGTILISVVLYFVAALIWQRNVFGVIGRFISYMITSLLIIFDSIIIFLLGPAQYRLDDKTWRDPKTWHVVPVDHSEWNVILDTHSHTTASDGKMSYEQSIWYHLAVGFNAVVFTDHETLGNVKEIRRLKEKYKNKMIIIQGIEMATNKGHFNVIGVKKWDTSLFDGLQGYEKLKKIVEEAHAQGAVVSVNHYPWSTGGQKPRYDPKTHLSRDEAIKLGIDLIEACNWDDDISPIDGETLEFCKSHPQIAPVAGTDIHDPIKDSLWGWTLLKTGDFSEDAIMEQLRAKKTSIHLEPEGIPYTFVHPESRFRQVLKPMLMVGEMFVSLHEGGKISNVNIKSIIAWIGWLILIFFISESLLYLISLIPL
ncbi:MAG: PHP domain-containing protein [Promethearchaeota archaeon]